MNKKSARKIAVVGVGSVGASVAYALAISGLASELVLVDIDKSKAAGEALDLAHAAAFIKPISIYAGSYADCRDAGIVVFCAGGSQKKGETRLDLLQKNYAILRDSLKQLQCEGSEVMLLLVSNPVDVLTYAALKLTGLPPQQVFGSGTVLDSSRFRHALSSHCGVASRNIHAYVVGEHGDSEVLLWSLAHIAGIGAGRFCALAGLPLLDRAAVEHEVRHAAYDIIAAKGATYYAISLAVLRICESIIRDEDSVLTLSGLVDGAYGLQDCCLGLPCVVNAQGRGRPLELPLNAVELDGLRRSAEILKGAIGQISL